MANRLADATSPYLLQHADNPVDWWQWGEEAFAEARRRDVPVLLSVGYAACHWCHVMAHESFEDEATAALMNERFVNIKVDREERPDVDAVYMTATQAMTGHGGWPMTCFLTPEGEPFHCGTYYPPAPRAGMPSFRQLLDAVDKAWSSRDAEVRGAGARVVAELSKQTGPLQEAAVDEEVLAGAATSLLGEYDRRNGGFGDAPKFPPSMVLEFLLRHHERTGSVESLSIVERTAVKMAAGGIYDQLDGGFARYSVDARWTVPHFEKMLYDNALLLRVYTHLTRLTGSARYREVAEDTAGFLLDRLRTREGGFAASLDADTDGVEGLTYVWTPVQLAEALGQADGAWAANLLGVTGSGTFEHGMSTLQLLEQPDDPERWRDVRARLLAARLARPQPARDDKVITAWNGMAIAALAEAGVVLGDDRWLAAARAAAELVVSLHLVDGRLRRASRDDVVGAAAGVLEDYGLLAEGLLVLHQATGAGRWLDVATGLLDTALDHFASADASGAFHDTADDSEALVWRPSDIGDNASPSGSSAIAGALLLGSALAGPDRAARYRAAAEAAVTRAGMLAGRVPRFAGHWLSVAEAMVRGPVQVALAGSPDDPRTAELRSAAVLGAPGGSVVLAGPPDAEGVPLLAGRGLVDGAPAAYVCRGYVCDRPVTTVADLVTALSR
ncbi:MAG TPA: thioredoxin domain-containing protein [Actinophytocola sp.]|uniref:thioredoxin domain-containing protein n=1 Tax=Actinophytocola sp. TaxID=1872138 RepID=UPI002DB719A3|nr:thioredoxin domain-containing protein [Actinophytocola sp.]HEU5472031.1 thioredoxin domain-containing protein [Actinophytocola sp.]